MLDSHILKYVNEAIFTFHFFKRLHSFIERQKSSVPLLPDREIHLRGGECLFMK